MYFKTLCALTVLVLHSAIAQNSINNKVKVTVYYESLCPDSKKFITEQLHPALTDANNSLANYVDLLLIPYGKSKFQYDNIDKSYNFSCHHGEDECRGNKIHACGLRKIAGGQTEDKHVKRVALDFVYCLMDKVDLKIKPVDFDSKDCAARSGVTNFAEVDNCSRHADGANYLANYGTQTDKLSPPLSSVPTIVFNDVYKKEDSDEAQKNFALVVCGYLGKDAPEECQKINSGSTRAFQSFILLATLLAFIGIY